MKMKPTAFSLVPLLAAGLVAPPALAQHAAGPDHATHAARPPSSGDVVPRATLPGQDAYGAIAEIVRILEQDSTTNWATVDLERLRRHLVDMSDVTLRASVVQQPVPGGVRMDVTGAGPVGLAVRRMTAAHAAQLAPFGFQADVRPIADGVRLTVTVRDRSDERLIAKARGLGFIGLLTLGEHHAAHHLAIARGAPMDGHEGSHGGEPGGR